MSIAQSQGFSPLNDQFFHGGQTLTVEPGLVFADFSFEILAALATEPESAIPPGTELDEWLAQHGEISRELAAERLGLTDAELDLLVVGARALTPALAYEMELLTGVSERLWLDLERCYREQILSLDAATLAEREWPRPPALPSRSGDPYP